MCGGKTHTFVNKDISKCVFCGQEIYVYIFCANMLFFVIVPFFVLEFESIELNCDYTWLSLECILLSLSSILLQITQYG